MHHLPNKTEICAAGAPQSQPAATAYASSYPGSEAITDSILSEPTILLAEDDEDLLKLTSAFLRTTGYKVLSCSNGRIAAEVYRRVSHVDLLVTDLRMPELSGMELARELTKEQPSLPVLMISGDVVAESVEAEMLERGWHFLAKPWRFPDLLACVHLMLGSASLEEAAEPW